MKTFRNEVPQGHALIGVNAQGVVTRKRAVKSLIWIVGGSGSGKTNTASLRVDEDYAYGNYFLVIDPHWFKEDSLYNAIKGYADRFLWPTQLRTGQIPVAYEPEDIVAVLDYFLDEFKHRKGGVAWNKRITIIVEEVGSLTTDKPETKLEEEMIAKIKQVARICGQELRDFDMAGMYVSQDAAGLAWLRKRAIMVLAHQLLMMSERLLACNENAEIARAMDDWPIGRTLVYGIGFKEGQQVYQQPVLVPKRIVDAVPSSQMEDLQPRMTGPLREQQAFKPTSTMRRALHLVEVDTEGEIEAASEVGLKGNEGEKEQIILTELEKKIGLMFFDQRKGANIIAKELWPDVKGGDAYQKNANMIADAIRKVAAHMKVGA